MSSELVVSIINYRTPDLTLNCVRSVLAAGDGIALSVVIIDNASGDQSVVTISDWIDAQDPPVPVTLMVSEANLGFAGGHNAVMRAYPAEFYLLLNSDTLVRAGTLAGLLTAAQSAPQAGLLAPALEDEDGTRQISCFRLHSPASELIRGAATGPVTAMLARYDIPLGLDPAPTEIGWVSFACVLIRQEVFVQTGGMDDGFFLYYEDAEFCHRVCKTGWQIAHVPTARVAHFRGGSGPVKALSRAARRLPSYYYRSRTRYFRKLYGRTGPLAANLCWGAGRLIAVARRLVGKPVPKANASEWRDIWIGFMNPLHLSVAGE
jgi:GT2 family glycosyltransferase